MTDNLALIDSLDPAKLHVLFIGGCGSFGMNMTAYIIKQQLYLVDAGLAFAAEYEIGIDSYTANIDDLVEKFGGVSAYFITHGHEDHVGALPLLLERWPAPVYATAWTWEIIKNRLLKFSTKAQFPQHMVQAGETISTEGLKIHWIQVPHSIPGCCSLLIMTEDKVKVLHTGDFKFDLNPYQEAPIDTKILEENSPVTALISDSTNSLSPGRCPSEHDVIEPLRQALNESSGTIVFSTFASNFWRLQIIMNLAQELGKKVYLSGGSLLKTLEIANELGQFTPPAGLIIDEGQLSKVQREDLIVLASGSQGESRSGLRRIVFDEHRQVKLRAGDTIILSSRVIPGNEKQVAILLSEAARRGIHVKSSRSHPNIHVSGHAYQRDLEDFIAISKAKFYIPVHGTFTQLLGNGNLHPRSFSVQNGSLLRVSHDGIESLGKLNFFNHYIDSWSQRPMNYETMRSRHKIGDSGMALVSGVKDRLDIEFIGLPFSPSQQESLCQRIRSSLGSVWNQKDEAELNEWARLHVRRLLSSELVKKPVVFSKLYK